MESKKEMTSLILMIRLELIAFKKFKAIIPKNILKMIKIQTDLEF
jgi:hypothetical protein